MLFRFTTLAFFVSTLSIVGCGGPTETAETIEADAEALEFVESDFEVTTPSESEADRDSAFVVPEENSAESEESSDAELTIGDPSPGGEE